MTSMKELESKKGITLDEFFREFMDEAQFRDYRNAERIVANLKRQGNTISGSPRIRPSDCGKAISSLTEIFENNKQYFRTGDLVYISRFEQLIVDLSGFCHKNYPSEALGAHILRARIRMFSNDPDGALEIIQHYAERPYLIEGSFEHALMIAVIYGQAYLQKGTLDESRISFIDWARWLTSIGNQRKSWKIGEMFAPFIVARAAEQSEKGIVASLIRRLSKAYIEASRGSGSWPKAKLRALRAKAYSLQLALLFSILATKQRNRRPRDHQPDN